MRAIFIGVLVALTAVIILTLFIESREPKEYDPDEWEDFGNYTVYLDDYYGSLEKWFYLRWACLLAMVWTLAIIFLEIYKGVPPKVDLETLKWFELAEEKAEREAAELGIDADMAMVVTTCHQEGLNKFQIAEYYKISLADVNTGIALHRERMEELVDQRDLHDL